MRIRGEQCEQVVGEDGPGDAEQEVVEDNNTEE
jgi:hypothetical protein